jgi:hypothetical protein
MYIPDHGFIKKLKRYDQKLNIRWNVPSERWVVTRFTPSDNKLYDIETHIMTVKGPNNEYRNLDDRVLNTLAASDHHRLGARRVIDEMMAKQDKRQDEIDKDWKSDVADIAKEIAKPLRDQASEDFGSPNLPKEDYKPAIEHVL